MSDNTLGCALASIAVALGVWWVFDKYEVRKRAPPPIVVAQAKPMRLTGSVEITQLDDGTVWFIDASNVKGGRTARLAWLTEDFTKNEKERDRSALTLYRVNCDTTGYTALSTVRYNETGSVTHSWTNQEPDKGVDYPPPGSLINSFINKACHEGFDAPQ